MAGNAKKRHDFIRQQTNCHRDPAKVWQAPYKWITPRQVLPPVIDNEELARIFELLRNGTILKARSATGGTQLKLLLELEGGQEAIFKPKQTEEGADLHNSEIAAFHLSRLLNILRAPIAVGRRLDIEKEIYPVATPEFRNTFMEDEHGKRNCFNGICKFCIDPVCPEERDSRMEGVMILMLPKEIRNRSALVIGQERTRFPLHALGDTSKKPMELMNSKDYCDVHVKPDFPIEPRILDVVETSIIDFLIQNGDRHQHEFIDKEENGGVLLIDQGKGFQPNSSSYDDMKLLMPLTSCCTLRNTKYEHLLQISRWDAQISDILLYLTSVDIATHPWYNPNNENKAILTRDDLAALDRRFMIVVDAMITCIEERGRGAVLVDSPL